MDRRMRSARRPPSTTFEADRVISFAGNIVSKGCVPLCLSLQHPYISNETANQPAIATESTTLSFKSLNRGMSSKLQKNWESSSKPAAIHCFLATLDFHSCLFHSQATELGARVPNSTSHACRCCRCAPKGFLSTARSLLSFKLSESALHLWIYGRMRNRSLCNDDESLSASLGMLKPRAMPPGQGHFSTSP